MGCTSNAILLAKKNNSLICSAKCTDYNDYKCCFLCNRKCEFPTKPEDLLKMTAKIILLRKKLEYEK